jgi:Ribonuclease G/E
VSERRAYLDIGVGETRGLVTLDGRPERLLVARDGDLAVQALGAEVVGRVRKLERQLALAFVDLGAGPEGVLNLRPDMARLTEGQAVAVEIRAEARGDKGAQLRLIGEAEGAPRLRAPAPAIEAELTEIAPRHPLKTGAEACAACDAAEAEALETVFPLPGGGTIAIERTRALTAVDVDLGDRPGGEAKRAARAANLAALAAAARVLRLKGEGGLVVFDLAGRGHDGPAMLTAARAAFAADGGVAFGPISRFGTLELTIPRRRRSLAERLADAAGALTAETLALRLIRALGHAAEIDPGARLAARAAPDVAAAAAPYLKRLTDRFGARLDLAADAGRARDAFEIAPSPVRPS